jgi:circadian clock protein KaiB
MNLPTKEHPMILTLYVSSSSSARSAAALVTIRRICEQELTGRVVLEVVDIHRNPEALIEDQIMAIPTLVKRLPPPLRRIIGDLSNEERVRAALQLSPHKGDHG